MLLTACGGSSGGGGGDAVDPPPSTEAEWHKSVIGEVASDGISARVVAVPAGDDTVYIAYFDHTGDSKFFGGIQYAEIHLSGNTATVIDSESDLVRIDNTDALDMALDDQG
jgi:hypothetical protein